MSCLNPRQFQRPSSASQLRHRTCQSGPPVFNNIIASRCVGLQGVFFVGLAVSLEEEEEEKQGEWKAEDCSENNSGCGAGGETGWVVGLWGKGGGWLISWRWGSGGSGFIAWELRRGMDWVFGWGLRRGRDWPFCWGCGCRRSGCYFLNFVFSEYVFMAARCMLSLLFSSVAVLRREEIEVEA